MEKTLILFDKIDHIENKEIIYFNEIIRSRYLGEKYQYRSSENKNIFEPYGLTEQLLYEDAKYLDSVFDKYINKISQVL